MRTENETVSSSKPRKPKSRDVSSRFLSPISSSSTPPQETPIRSSPYQPLSPILRKSTSTDIRKHHRNVEDSGSTQRLWPSSSSSQNQQPGTLADHLGNERLNDFIQRKIHGLSDHHSNNNISNGFSLNRQKSYGSWSGGFGGSGNRFEKENATENNRPGFGGSMRYTGNSKSPAKSFSSASSPSSSFTNNTPGRFSFDEKLLCSSSSSDITKSPSLLRTTRKQQPQPGIEVSSKYLHELPSRSRRWTTSDSTPISSSENSPKIKKFSIKNAIKRANSLTGGATSQWALSPGRSGSPLMSVENKAAIPMSFSTLKPPTSPSKAKGVEKLLHLGFDLFKSKKHSSSSSVESGLYDLESVHQLRLLHNCLMQWRFANVRSESVGVSLVNQAEVKLLCVLSSITKLHHSVIHKRIQFQKEKLEMKLDYVLKSQIKPLETWMDMERQHISSISMTKQCLHSVVCKVPLIEGAKVDLQSASMAFRHASDVTASIDSMLTTFSPSAEKTIASLSVLAEVVAQEKLLLEECLELFKTISELENEEMSLKSYLIQMESQGRT